MATAPTNHWKVGLFVISGIVLALCALVFLGVESLRNEHVRYHTYFDEPVQGLDIGAPIEFRGVKVGQVADIRIASDRRHVDVVCALFTKNLRNLGLSKGEGDDTRMEVPADLRILMAMQGVTGQKALQIDYLDPKSNPPPTLPFKPDANYIPSALSTFTKLQASVTGAMDQVPTIVNAVVSTTDRANRIIASFEDAKLADHANATLARADRAFESIEAAATQAQLGKVSAQAQASLANLDAVIQRAGAVMARLDGDNGLLASVQRTSNAVGDVASASPALGEEMVATLRDFQEAAAAVRRLADALERNPDMLLKGRAKGE